MNEGQSLLSKHTKTKKNEILGVPVTKTGNANLHNKIGPTHTMKFSQLTQ